MTIDELRAGLQRQARAAEEWDPPVLTPRRPAPARRRAGLAVVLSAALVAAVLLVVPGWWGGGDDATRGPQVVPGGPPAFTVESWEPVTGGCTGPRAACQVPERIEVGGRVLVRTGLALAERPVADGTLLEQQTAPLDLPGRQGWVMTGLVGDGSTRVLGVAVDGAGIETRADANLLVRIGGGPRLGVPVTATARGVQGQDARQFLATYDRPAVEPRQDWTDAGESCDGAGVACATPPTVVLDDRVLRDGGFTYSVAAGRPGTVRSEVAEPGDLRWLMIGELNPDGGPAPTSVLLSLGGQDPVVLDATRPVLVRLPDGVVGYEVSRDDGAPTTLFTKVYLGDD